MSASRRTSRTRAREGCWSDTARTLGSSDDDNASDWAWELQEADDWSVVAQALRGAADVDANAYLEAPDGQIAWAAAAVVAASELAELWRETDDHEWRANVESLAGLLA